VLAPVVTTGAVVVAVVIAIDVTVYVVVVVGGCSCINSY
jgi:hypothetical protein